MNELKEVVERMNKQKEEYKTAHDNFLEQHKILIDDIEKYKEEEDRLRTIIKEEALTEYKTTGTKHFDCGVGIRVMTNLDYDKTEAFNWAKSHQIALTLDKSAFNKIAKIQDIDFVTKSEVATATIPMKL